jgi:LPS O-antigen subunit length determinant protein (WzzB/FepE family)
MRTRDLQEAEKNLVYLRQQLAESNVVELQEAVSRLIENEMQTAMLARAREEYAFTVIDTAMVPMERSRPHRSLIVVISTAAGGLLAVIIAILAHTLRRQREARRAREA